MSTTSRRASTRDRETATSTLSAALAEGMLTISEFDDRIGAVAAATYQDELTLVTADVDHVADPDRARVLKRLRPEVTALVMSAAVWANEHRGWQ